MPPNNTPAPPIQSSNARRRPTTERIVPAIPLALTKPRPTKSQPKTQPKPEVSTEELEEGVTAKNGDVNGELRPVVSNGESHTVVEVAAVAAEPVADGDGDGVSSRAEAVVTPKSAGSAAVSLNNAGATPEAPAVSSRGPSTPPLVHDSASAISPPSTRKQADRFDIRQIRTELPPAFVPSAEQHTPRSAASSNSTRPQFLPHGHPTHPSVGTIVFGGQDSLTSSPVPPTSGGFGFAPPPFSSSQQPYSVSNGHAHHVSEPHGQRMYQPSYQHPQAPWNARQPYGQPLPNGLSPHSHTHAPFRYPPREVFTPTEPRMPNGDVSREGSQASSGAQDGHTMTQLMQSPIHSDAPRDSQSSFSRHTHPRPPFYNQHHFQQPPPPFSAPTFNADLENADALRAHLLSEISNDEFADCQLQISDATGDDSATVKGHSVILSCSPTLLDLIRSTQPSGSGMKHVEVKLQGRYNRVNAFNDALRYLYGGPLLQLSYHRPTSSAGDQLPTNPDRMESALQHISVGAWLRMPALANRGVEVATNLLHWDTVLPALTFALDGGLSNYWNVDDGSEDRASTSSSDDSLSKPEPSGSPTYDPHSTRLLERILEFIVHMFPLNFYVDASAPQLESCPRLPSIPHGHESRPSRSDPRLSQIRFGEVPIEPSFATTTVSSIMLSLPFVLLKCVLEHGGLVDRLGPDTVSSIMRQVVSERETRRLKLEKARTAAQLEGQVDPSLAQNMSWQESVEPSALHRAGSRLYRRRKGIDTPPSSGACSERNK